MSAPSNKLNLSEDQKLKANDTFVLNKLLTMNRNCINDSSEFNSLIANGSKSAFDKLLKISYRNEKLYEGFLKSTEWDRTDLKEIVQQIAECYTRLIGLLSPFRSKYLPNDKKQDASELIEQIGELSDGLNNTLAKSLNQNKKKSLFGSWFERAA